MTPSPWRRAIADRPRAHLVGLLSIVALGLALASALAKPIRAEDAPAASADDALLKLVPADAGLILTVDNFRDRSRAILETRIAQEFQRLPAFSAWLDSPNVRRFDASREKIEDFFQASFREIGDEIFGDSVALALIAPSNSPADARGLLVLRARDPKLLNRLIDRINETQKTNGELAAIAEHKRGDSTYFTREFHQGSGRPNESFVTFPDGTFALSNSNSLIEWVIDREAKPEGDSAADLPGFQKVSERLPGNAAVRLFLNADLARRVAENLPSDNSPRSRKALEVIQNYADALQYAGAALTVDDAAIAVQSAQSFDPEKLRELAGWWISSTSPERVGPGPRLGSIPPSALAFASININVASFYGSLARLLPEKDRPKLEKVEIIAKGLLLGLDLRTRVLPALGPRVVAYLETPADDSIEPAPKGLPLPLVVATEIREPAGGGGGAPSVAEALDNALRAFMAALALDESRVPPESRVETKNAVTALNVPYPFAFAVDRPGRRIALGSSAAAVARYLEADVDPEAGSRFRQLRDAAFPNYGSFVCLDLAAIADLAARRKDRLIDFVAKRRNRPTQGVAGDFDQALALVRLFDAAFLAVRIDDANALVEHSLGLVPRPAEGEAETKARP